MSLVRLLSLGQTLDGLNESPGHYRMARQSMLPKFGPGTPPVSASVILGRTEPTMSPAPASSTAEKDKEVRRSATSASASERSAPGTKAVRTLGNFYMRVGTLLVSGARWLNEVNPLRERPARGAIPNFGAKRPTGTSVQAELSLDKIKVVRNDLSDSDLEIVPSRPEAAIAIVTAALAKPKGKPKTTRLARRKPRLSPAESYNH